MELPGTASPGEIARAVRGESVSGIEVTAPTPGPVYDHVGVIDGTGTLRLRPALAAAARSLGNTAPQDPAIEDCRERLAALDPPVVETEQVRRRVAAAGRAEDRLHERVAELRGRVQALESAGDEVAVADARERLAAATTELTEARTERLAAEQALDRATERAREARSVRERRLRLEDRLGNLRRRARAYLADGVYDGFVDALDEVPGDASAGDDPSEFAADPTTGTLAIARIAEIRAPVVVACGRFRGADTAAAAIDGPVIWLPAESGG